MGVIYKLHPKIRNFILQSKQIDPNLSCRGLSALISDKFQIQLSKSRVNFVIKQAGLSMPVGRRRKAKKNIYESDGLGATLLKSTDSLVGGVDLIANIIKNTIKSEISDLNEKIEYQLYSPLFDLNPDTGLWALIGKKLLVSETSLFLDILKETKITEDINQKFTALYDEIRGYKFNLASGNSFYIDGQFHTVWSRNNVPVNFIVTNYIGNSYINNILKHNEPIVLMSAPGFEMPSREFFEFLLCSRNRENKVGEVYRYDLNLQESRISSLDNGMKLKYVFGFWPWQYSKFRSVKVIGEFKHFNFEPQDRDFYIAESEVELSQPDMRETIRLRGCALKTGREEKIKVIILTNIDKEEMESTKLTNLFLTRWPNLEEGFQDYSRKIELFTYSPEVTRSFIADGKISFDNVQSDISILLSTYLNNLDRYIRLRFMALGYAKKSFQEMIESFYSLSARIKLKKEYAQVTFLVVADYLYINDLEYCCRRLNEAQIRTFKARKVWFNAKRAE